MSEVPNQPLEAAEAPSAKGTRWSPEEDFRLATTVVKLEGTLKQRVRALAQDHNRTPGAIESRLNLLGLVEYGPYTKLITDTHPLDTSAEDKPLNQGQPWTEPETAALLVAHHINRSMEELGKELGRTARSCALKLFQLGVLEPTINGTAVPRTIVSAPAKPKAEPKRIAAPTGTTKITVTPEFQTALHAIEAGENLLILGSAGTGKSTFLKWLRKKLEAQKLRYAVLAPTGMAGLNVGGQTIHSFFSLKPQLLVDAPLPRPRNPKVFANIDLIIVDEISMVRADIFDTMDKMLRKYAKNSKKPFGGVQMVLMGDLCQLPPVVRSDEASIFQTQYPTPYFFSTPAWELGNFSTLRFTQIFRQTDEPFINLLNAIRYGKADNAILTKLNERVTNSPPPEAVVLAARNRSVDLRNQQELDKLPGVARTYTADVMGNAEPSMFTTPLDLMLKVGARVMFTRNSKTGLWVNGTLGTVKKLSDDEIVVETENGPFTVEREKWESTKYQFSEKDNAPVATVAGTFTQFPLTLAWALTIHKSQGQTLPSCVIDLADGGTFAEGQLYVALSRARSLESLHLTTPIQPRHIKTSPYVTAFYEALDLAS